MSAKADAHFEAVRPLLGMQSAFRWTGPGALGADHELGFGAGAGHSRDFAAYGSPRLIDMVGRAYGNRDRA